MALVTTSKLKKYLHNSPKDTMVDDIVEMGVRFTLDYGDIDAPFYYSMESMYDSAAKFTIDNNITREYLPRFEKFLSDANSLGWGFYDSLDEIYHLYFNKNEI